MNGRSKGQRGEREAVAWLQAWWKGKEDSKFVRVPASGGWQNASVRGELKAVGDIMCTDDAFPFTVEVKYQERWDRVRLYEGKRSPVWKWWEQAVAEGKEAGRIPLLMVRKNHHPWLFILPTHLGSLLSDQGIEYHSTGRFLILTEDEFRAFRPEEVLA
jgi:Holliday junction resolvase